ncbi:MAG: type IV pilus biogenesis protein PilM [Limisphaerales bacterium]
MADRDMLPAFPLKKPASSRAKLPAQATALDFDSRSLRVASPGLSRVAVAPLNLPADADRTDAAVLGAALAKALEQLKVKPGAVVMGLPRAQVVLKTLLLPVIADVSELASVVHLQVGRDLPFRLADAVVDFQVLRQITPPAPKPDANAKPGAEAPAAPPPKLEVLVAAAKREAVEFYQRVASAAGVKLVALGLLPNAGARCVEACRVVERGQTYALVSLRPDEVSIDIVTDAAVPFSRGAGVKPAEPNAPEAFVSAATIEVVRSLHSHGGQGAAGSPAKLFVVGATTHEDALVNALSTRMNTPVALLDTAALDLPRDSRADAAGTVAAMGLTLGYADAGGLPFDFLNPKRPAVPRDTRRIKILAGLAATTALFLIVAGVRAWLIGKRQAVLDGITAEAVAAEKFRPEYRKVIGQASVVNEWVRGERDWLMHYAYLAAVLPRSEEMYLTSFAVSGPGALRLGVRAKSGELLAKVEKQLRAAGYDVKPLAITPGSDKNGYEFQSTVELAVPDKLKIDLTKVKAPPRPADDASLDPPRKKGGG